MLIKILLEKGVTVSKLCDIIKLYPQVLVNAKVNNDKKADLSTDVDIQTLIQETEKQFEGNGRVLIRPSGTEPVVRVMIEGENQEKITNSAKKIAELIEYKLGWLRWSYEE